MSRLMELVETRCKEDSYAQEVSAYIHTVLFGREAMESEIFWMEHVCVYTRRVPEHVVGSEFMFEP